MRHFLTLLLLTGSSLCYGQFARDSEPLEPSLVSAAEAQTYYAQLYASQSSGQVYLCDSKTAKAYYKDQNCRGLDQCTHEGVKVTNKQAEEDHGRVPCQVCY